MFIFFSLSPLSLYTTIIYTVNIHLHIYTYIQRERERDRERERERGGGGMVNREFYIHVYMKSLIPKGAKSIL